MNLVAIITDYIRKSLLTVKGDLVYFTGAALARLGVGTAYQNLQVNALGDDIAYAFSERIKDTNDVQIKCEKIPIGDWNMDTSTLINISHSIDFTKIISINAVITNDIASTMRPLNIGISDIDGEQQGFVYSVSATVIQLRRLTGGYFDSTSYNDTSYNRGFIFVWYMV